jgi:hypothetical protein
MSVKKISSQSNKNHWSRYKSERKFIKNKQRKIQRHLRKHPNDKQSISVLSEGDFSHRKPPIIRGKITSSSTKKVHSVQAVTPKSIRDFLVNFKKGN